jgi:anti-sigma-K factor RskA
MNDSLLESANLYVLGLLTAPEQAAFEHELRHNPALQREVHALQEAVLALAHSAPQSAPPPDLRASLLADWETSANPVPPIPAAPPTGTVPQQSTAPTASPFRILHFIPWAAAAALAVLFYQNRNAIQTAREQAAAARTEAAVAQEREKRYLEAVQLSEAAKAQSDASLASLRTRLEQAETALNALGAEKEKLIAELTLLKQDSQLDKTRIAVLGSLLKDQPAAVAVSLWRQERQDGLLVVENLPALPPGRDYQLWVIDPNLKTPVSAGVFKVDAAGRVRLEFKPARPVQSAFKFAVTVEQEGGAELPTMDQMVVIGG